MGKLGTKDYIEAHLSLGVLDSEAIYNLYMSFTSSLLRQISSSVYHKLKIVHAIEKLTPARYLNMLENEEFERDLKDVV